MNILTSKIAEFKHIKAIWGEQCNSFYVPNYVWNYRGQNY